ncbi:hypothetical protein GVN21_09485 [Caulobacter sp. SLTY]|uniref:hypothetical protein n=1 Tax=Caulobacter sp. SLTY TaxID=2683262 RepID=UPI001413655A|nr:hypothetical protein [Caulobacter sp. SLTY]NBB15585.1 hypothetical protein [Caulobacter sp. SLTY]
MSDQQPGPEGQPPATPFWKTPWAIGGAVIVAGLLGYQAMQQNRGPEVPTRPVGPNDNVGGNTQAPTGYGTPQAPPQAGQGGWPVAQPNEQPAPFQPIGGQPTPQGQQGPNGQPGPQPQPPVTPPQPPGGMVERDGQQMFPLLAKPGGDLPFVNVSYTPYIGSNFDFRIETPEGQAMGNVMIPDGWGAGWVTISISQLKNHELMSFGAATADLGNIDGVPVRAVRPNWTVDRATMGGLCFAFIGSKGQSDVSLPDANFCVMDRTCGQAYACGKLRR